MYFGLRPQSGSGRPMSTGGTYQAPGASQSYGVAGMEGSLSARGAPGGFKNVPGRSRVERQMSADKDLNEKARLLERPSRYRREDLGNPIVPWKGSLSYASDAERHAPSVQGLSRRTDPAGDEHVRRLADIAHKQAVVAYKRNLSNAREGARWERIEQEYDYMNTRMAALREQGTKGRSNWSGIHYHPFTHEYHPSQQGQMLKYKDDLTRHRAARRADYLSRQDHRCGYNVLTGADIAPVVKLPPLPSVPKPEAHEARLMPFRVDLAYKGHVNSVADTVEPSNQRGRSMSLVASNVGGRVSVSML